MCNDYYVELRLHNLLDGYKQTSIEIEKYKKFDNANMYPEDEENIKGLITHL